jgi:hypothetical protein
MGHLRRALSARLATFSIALTVLATGSAASCGTEPQRRGSGGASATEAPGARELGLPDADLRLVLLTDLDGYLEPCGCTSRPLGGIDRLAARLRALRAGGPPTVLLAAGNLFFHGAPHGADAARSVDQETWRAETLSSALTQLDLSAASPGLLDFSFGSERFARLASSATFPLLAAGMQYEGPNAGERETLSGSTLRQVGALRLGVVGISDLRGPDGALPDGIRVVTEPSEAAPSEVRSLRARGADVVVALLHGERRFGRRVAGEIEGVDFLVQGGLDALAPSPPSDGEGAVIVSAGRQGQGIVVIDLWRRGDGPWRDVSPWTRDAQRSRLGAAVAELRERIRSWEADRSVDARDVAEQRARLERLESELRALDRPPSTAGNVFVARYEELGPESPREPSVRAILEGLDRRVNDHNRRIFADWMPEPAPAGSPHYVGSQACAACHGAAVRWWRGTPHGRAYETLTSRNKNYNLHCVGCHVTGYLRPGGSTVTHVESLQDVGCESCHGPGSAHVASPAGAAGRVVRAPTADVCVGCHNAEHSDRFHFETYRQLLIAPGHGLPSGG